MSSFRLNRRTLLAGVGGLSSPALLSPFVPLMARGAVTPPRRVLFYFHPMGFLEDYFWPTAAEIAAVKPGSYTETFTLGESIKALTPWKNKITLVDGINCFGIGVSNVNYKICDNAHGKGVKMMFTGAKTLGPNGNKPGNPRAEDCTNDLASGWQPADGP